MPGYDINKRLQLLDDFMHLTKQMVVATVEDETGQPGLEAMLINLAQGLEKGRSMDVKPRFLSGGVCSDNRGVRKYITSICPLTTYIPV